MAITFSNPVEEHRYRLLQKHLRQTSYEKPPNNRTFVRQYHVVGTLFVFNGRGHRRYAFEIKRVISFKYVRTVDILRRFKRDTYAKLMVVNYR